MLGIFKKRTERISRLNNMGVGSPQKDVAQNPYLYTPDPRNTKRWHGYYQAAEDKATTQFNTFIKPIIDDYNDISYEHVMDFACGFGRMSWIFKEFSKNICLVDINNLAVEHCKERFSNDSISACKFTFCTCDNSLTLPLNDDSFSFIFSWDAMVHFSYRWLDYYMYEFQRIVNTGGHILVHHSNYGNIDTDIYKSENYTDNPNSRSNIKSEDMAFIAKKHGLDVIEQRITNWGGVESMDCISLFRKRG